MFVEDVPVSFLLLSDALRTMVVEIHYIRRTHTYMELIKIDLMEGKNFSQRSKIFNYMNNYNMQTTGLWGQNYNLFPLDGYTSISYSLFAQHQILMAHMLQPTRENFLRIAPSLWATTNLRNASNRDERVGEVLTRLRIEKQERK